MKKPLLLSLVTTPEVLTVWPTRGLAAPLPWICGIVTTPDATTLKVQEADCDSLLSHLRVRE